MARSLFSLILLFLIGNVYSQTDTEFWFAVPEVTSGHNSGGGEPTYLHLSALDVPAEITIEMPMQPAFVPITITIPANTTQKVDLTQYIRTNYVSPANDGTANQANILELGLPGDYGLITNKGVRIESSSYITAYLERDNQYNNDIWALKGKTAYGEEFYVPSQNSDRNGNYTPTPLYSIDIVAVEDAEVWFYPPAGKTVKGFGTGIQVRTLKRGQTLCLVADGKEIGDHLGGTLIWTQGGKVAVQWKDDSVEGNNCRDLMGDQIIPTKYAGNEYVVMRGELIPYGTPRADGQIRGCDEEYVYIMSLENGTEIEFSMVTPGGSGATTPANITLGAPGTIERVWLNERFNEIDALHMKSLGGEPFIVYHVAGFGCEKGAAILPSIKGCTGSTEVSFSRSTSEQFFLNIMCKEKFTDDFWIHIDGQPGPIQIPENWFTRIPGTGMDPSFGFDSTEWFFLDKQFNEFTNAQPGMPAIPVDRVTKVVNTDGLFHLAVINGGQSSGCRYGYFSDFSDNLGEAVIGGTNTDFLFYCFNDTSQLQARGGIKYSWRNLNTNPPYPGTFVDATTLSSPRIAPPPGQMFYEVTITRACYPELLRRDTIIEVGAIGYPEVDAIIDTTMLSPGCCSPVTLDFVNNSIGSNQHEWDIQYLNNGTDLDTISYVFGNDTDPAPKGMLFRNRTDSTVDLAARLYTTFTYNCPDTAQFIISVAPEIEAVVSKGSRDGCNENIIEEFSACNSLGPYKIFTFYWGDGSDTTLLAEDSCKMIPHLFTNYEDYDTTYFIHLGVIDTLSGCEDISLQDSVFVPGVARARYSVNKTKGCSPLDVTFTNWTRGNVSYQWWFRNGNNFQTLVEESTSNFTDTTITYTNTGVVPQQYYSFLIITKENVDLLGNITICTDTFGIDTITVYPEFNVVIDQPNQAGCNPYLATLSSTLDKVLPNMTYFWNFGDGTTSGLEDPSAKEYSHIIPADQTYDVSLIATSEFECKDTAPPITVDVYAFLESNFTIVPDTFGCSPFVVTLANNTSVNSVKNFTWNLSGGAGATSDAAPFNVTFNNTTHLNNNPVISLTNRNDHAACDVTYSKRLTVKPVIVADFQADDNTICHGDSVLFTNISHYVNNAPIRGAVAEYLWDFGDGTTSSVETLYHKFVNTDNAQKDFTVSLTVTIDGCENTYSEVVSVLPELKPQFTADSYVLCTPTTVNIRNTSIGAASSFWRFSDGTTYNTNDITHTFTNPPNSNTINTHTLTLTVSNSQCNRVLSKAFSVYPELNPQFTPSVTSGCEPLSVSFTNNSTGGALSDLIVEWDWNDGNTEINDNGSLNYTFKNLSPVDIVRNVELKITNDIGCSDSVLQAIDVFAHVDSKFTIDDTVSCSPFVVNLINNTSAKSAQNFVWNFNVGIPMPNANNPSSVTYLNRGDSDISPDIVLTNGNGHPACNKIFTKTVTVKPEVTSQFSADRDLICHGGSIQFTNTSEYKNGTAINTSAITQFSWDFGDGATSNLENPSHKYLNTENNGTTPQDFTVTLTLTVDGCTDVYTSVVRVYPEVKADFVSDDYVFCSPNTEEIRNLSVGAASFQYTFNDGTTWPAMNNTNPQNKLFTNTDAENIRTVNVTLTATNDFCFDVTSKPYSVYPEVVVDFTQDVTEGCNPIDVTFINNSTGRLSYEWDFNDGQTSSEKNPSHSFTHIENRDKTFTVELVGEQEVTGCTESATVDITSYSYIKAKFGLTKAGLSKGIAATGEIVGGCTPFDVVITDSSVTNGTWEWDFGNGSDSIVSNKPAPIDKTYLNTSSTNPLQNEAYSISLAVENARGCRDSITRTLEVYPRTSPDFNAVYAGCNPHPVTFDNITVDDRNTSYFWDYGDGASSSDRDPYYVFNNYNYTQDTVYTVKLTASTQYRCVDDTTKTITVYPKPLARIVPDIGKGCAPLGVTFTDASIGKNGYQVMWDLGDGNGFATLGSQGGTISNTYQNTNNSEQINTFNAKIAIETAAPEICRDTAVYSIHAYPEVEVDFSLNEAGCSPHNVRFTNLSNGAVSLYNWDFGYSGESSVIRDPQYTYFNRTGSVENYNVYLEGRSKYGCSKDTTHEVTVYPSPKAYFDIDEPLQIYPDTVFTITNLSETGDYDYYWTMGDGSSEFLENNKSFDISYTGWAPNVDNNTYIVTLRVDGEYCDTAKLHKLRLLPPDPEVNIDNIDPQGCVPLTVNFDISSQYGNSFVWDFDDGTTSTEFEPVHEFTEDGIYNVKVVISGDGGERYDYIAVVVHPLPVVGFKFDPEYVMLPDDKVQFFNLTENGKSYLWNFGDGSISNSANPSYQYTVEGKYDVMLTATTDKGCVDSLIHSTQIEVSGAGSITFPNTFMPSEDSPADGSYEFPDLMNDVFHPHYKQVKEYNLYIYNRWGEQVFSTKNIREGWNGLYNNNGKPLSQGVYFWKSTGKYYNGTAFKKAGDVTLIRR